MKYLIFILILLSVSCRNGNNKVKKIYKAGQIYQEIFLKDDNESFDSIYFYKNNKVESKIINIDSLVNYCIFYYENGKIESKGEKYQNKYMGNWEFYLQNGKINKKLEYKIICDSSYLNQAKIFDEKGNILLDKSNFFTVEYERKSIINEKIKFSFKYNKINKKSKAELYVSQDLDSTFCNLDKLDFLISEFNNDSIYAKIGFSTKGKKNLRGFIKEYIPNDFTSDLDLMPLRIVYFDIPIEIY